MAKDWFSKLCPILNQNPSIEKTSLFAFEIVEMSFSNLSNLWPTIGFQSFLLISNPNTRYFFCRSHKTDPNNTRKQRGWIRWWNGETLKWNLHIHVFFRKGINQKSNWPVWIFPKFNAWLDGFQFNIIRGKLWNQIWKCLN